MTLNGKVMVTGGAGYIGSHAVLALLDAGYDVVVIDNLVTGFDWAVDGRAAFVRIAVEDPGVRDVIREHNVRAIMHFAGSVVVPESVSDPLKYYRNNTAATRSLIESAVAEGVPHFIFSSTAATYGTPERVPIGEDDPKAPINPYGMSKLMTEFMLKDVSAAHPMNHCCLRYFNVAGADPEGRSGQSTVGATHLIKIAVEAATGKRDGVGVFGTDFPTRDGTGVRDYIHVSDLAEAHVAALALLVERPTESHVLNCGYGRGFSVLEVLDAVDRVTNLTIERKLQGRRPGDPAELVADNSAILKTIDWTPKRDDLEGIVRDALAWERKLAERQA
ncbi:UDP-glucose 4-epimerase [Sphingomonas sp. BE138]|uniref:UDP-glucose 4-epimerase GalE n=1 Tax=Sphingomonas sp. BE138 TaxID=2817845 RepID=UPI002866673B|nr:UDP-glucose 4-epimerase GalE [Sphingomonas sp. BE138]MDR6789368.1 UDP-glucose 4-epimerase [Sphingomonas sp. BE138]